MIFLVRSARSFDISAKNIIKTSKLKPYFTLATHEMLAKGRYMEQNLWLNFLTLLRSGTCFFDFSLKTHYLHCFGTKNASKRLKNVSVHLQNMTKPVHPRVGSLRGTYRNFSEGEHWTADFVVLQAISDIVQIVPRLVTEYQKVQMPPCIHAK